MAKLPKRTKWYSIWFSMRFLTLHHRYIDAGFHGPWHNWQMARCLEMLERDDVQTYYERLGLEVV